MSLTVIVSRAGEPILYPAVHGGAGEPLRWRCFARRGMVFTEIEGFETARMAPGASIAPHTHTRTEEIYLVTRGHGVMTLDGQESPVGPGDLIMLPLGHSHGLVNTGEEDLEIVVLELLPPQVADALPRRTPVLEHETSPAS